MMAATLAATSVTFGPDFGDLVIVWVNCTWPLNCNSIVMPAHRSEGKSCAVRWLPPNWRLKWKPTSWHKCPLLRMWLWCIVFPLNIECSTSAGHKYVSPDLSIYLYRHIYRHVHTYSRTTKASLHAGCLIASQRYWFFIWMVVFAHYECLLHSHGEFH